MRHRHRCRAETAQIGARDREGQLKMGAEIAEVADSTVATLALCLASDTPRWPPQTFCAAERRGRAIRAPPQHFPNCLNGDGQLHAVPEATTIRISSTALHPDQRHPRGWDFAAWTAVTSPPAVDKLAFERPAKTS